MWPALVDALLRAVTEEGQSDSDVPIREVVLQWLYVYTGLVAFSYVMSVVGASCSQVDKMRPFVPVVFISIAAAHIEFQDARVMGLTFLVGLWGFRRFFHQVRRNLYAFPLIWNGEEDKRWDQVRLIADRLTENELAYNLCWELFSLLFVHAIQIGTLVLLVLPVLSTLQQRDELLTIEDWVLAGLMLACVAASAAAEEQAYFSKGLCQTGLFAACRHPNYLFEQLFWFLFTALATHTYSHCSIIWWLGAGLLIPMQYLSSYFSERALCTKYKGYKKYQEMTWRFFPWFGPNQVVFNVKQS
mmetsp:Transcript_786/g.1525  ORF Transcript_786/g.1525 Transcript_786/m.1525 type:complete len:301 (+) Transcript_786:109-1011(+)